MTDALPPILPYRPTGTPAEETPLPEAAAGAGAAVHVDVACPLCGYNLRGLSEPRCPECGYRFNWPDLLNPDRREHPYLFEHHPGHNLWSFCRTLAGGLLPWRFWSHLRPDHPSRPKRLLAYWGLTMLMMIVAIGLTIVGITMAATARHNAEVSSQLQFQTAVRSGTVSPSAGSVLQYPIPPRRGYLDAASYVYVAGDVGPALAVWGSAVLLWPWLTLGVLMIFRASMRKARVRTIHVLRCTLYSSDVALCAAVCLTALAWAAAVAAGAGLNVLDSSTDSSRYTNLLFLAFGAVAVVKLCIAYARYLRFDHPWATALAAQVILLLAGLVVAVQVAELTVR